MDTILIVMLLVSLVVLFMSGFYMGVLKEKYGKTWMFVIPSFVALLMVFIVYTIIGL